MSIILAIDTSTEACSVALNVHGELHETFVIEARMQARQVLPLVQRLLDEQNLGLAQVDALAFGRGPGSFTGLRIATGVVQGLAFGLNVPVVPVSTLAALAWQAWRLHAARDVIASLDARIGELYWACYRIDAEPRLLQAEVLCKPEAVPQPPPSASGWFGAGNGWNMRGRIGAGCAAQVRAVDSSLYPRARDIAELAAPALDAGRTVSAEEACPVYLREQVTHAQPSANE